jgi:hypothetical protein
MEPDQRVRRDLCSPPSQLHIDLTQTSSGCNLVVLTCDRSSLLTCAPVTLNPSIRCCLCDSPSMHPSALQGRRAGERSPSPASPFLVSGTGTYIWNVKTGEDLTGIGKVQVLQGDIGGDSGLGFSTDGKITFPVTTEDGKRQLVLATPLAATPSPHGLASPSGPWARAVGSPDCDPHPLWLCVSPIPSMPTALARKRSPWPAARALPSPAAASRSTGVPRPWRGARPRGSGR